MKFNGDITHTTVTIFIGNDNSAEGDVKHLLLNKLVSK